MDFFKKGEKFYDLEYKIINNQIVPIKNEEIQKRVYNLIYSLFECEELVKYWFNITSNSLFGNEKEQKFYIESGKNFGFEYLLYNSDVNENDLHVHSP